MEFVDQILCVGKPIAISVVPSKISIKSAPVPPIFQSFASTKPLGVQNFVNSPFFSSVNTHWGRWSILSSIRYDMDVYTVIAA